MFTQLNGLLRQFLREKEGRDAEPSACVIDAQSVNTSTSIPASSQSIDASKKIMVRKRGIVTDAVGFLLTVPVIATSMQDSVAGTRLLDQVAVEPPGIRKMWVYSGYRQHPSDTQPPSASTWRSPHAPPGPFPPAPKS